MKLSGTKGFTLLEVIVVLVIIASLTAIAIPYFANLQGSARASVIQQVAGSLKSTASIVQAKAYAIGLTPYPSNPGNQAALLVTTNLGSTEVDWRNLCPESQGELGNRFNMIDYMDLTIDSQLTTRRNNRYTLIGYDIPSGFSNPTNRGCYVIYDSFGNPNCTVTAVTVDC